MDLPRNATSKRRRLGLALSRQIAEGHGGELLLRNREDAPGARALLRLSVGAMTPTA